MRIIQWCRISIQVQHLQSSGVYTRYQNGKEEPLQDTTRSFSDRDLSVIKPQVTIVTAFLHPDAHSRNKPNMGDPYSRWMGWVRMFRNISNPVIAYFGSVQYYFHFEGIRLSRLRRTNMTIVDIRSLQTFKMKPRIEAILARRRNSSMNADLLCTMHAKYELLKRAAKQNPFRTSHMLWLDVGPYNQPYPSDGKFRVDLPPKFDHQRIAYRSSRWFAPEKTVPDVFRKNLVWMNGDFILGATQSVVSWCKTYLSAVKKYLKSDLVGTDEANLYAMMLDTDGAYRDLVKVYNMKDKGFSRWYKKISGLKRPFQGKNLPPVKRRRPKRL